MAKSDQLETKLDMEKISGDLFDHFENEIKFQNGVPNKADLEERTKKYLTRVTKEAEISGEVNIVGRLAKLYDTINEELLQAYVDYAIRKNDIIENREKNDWKKYVLGTVVVLNIAEAIATRGRSITSPAFIFASAIIEGIVGTAIYGGAKLFDKKNISEAEAQYFKTAEGINRRLTVDQKHEIYKDIMGAEVTEGEIFEITSKYNSPDQFWEDFNYVKKLDPKSENDMEVSEFPYQFREFLTGHVDGTFDLATRGNRFDRLSVRAHEEFVNRGSKSYN